MLSTISLRFLTFMDRFLSIAFPLHAIDELLRVSTLNVALDFSHFVLGCCSYRNEASPYSAVALQEASVFDILRLAVTSRLRRFSRYEEREKAMYDVCCGNACDVSVIVSGCDFHDVCATG